MNLWEFAFHIMKSLCRNFPLVLFIFELLAMLKMIFSKKLKDHLRFLLLTEAAPTWSCEITTNYVLLGITYYKNCMPQTIMVKWKLVTTWINFTILKQLYSIYEWNSCLLHAFGSFACRLRQRLSKFWTPCKHAIPWKSNDSPAKISVNCT